MSSFQNDDSDSADIGRREDESQWSEQQERYEIEWRHEPGEPGGCAALENVDGVLGSALVRQTVELCLGSYLEQILLPRMGHHCQQELSVVQSPYCMQIIQSRRGCSWKHSTRTRVMSREVAPRRRTNATTSDHMEECPKTTSAHLRSKNWTPMILRMSGVVCW
jgi:hypothetical protein